MRSAPLHPPEAGSSTARSPARSRFRFTITSRLAAVLSATAAVSTALALALHDRTLAADLEQAARKRLEGAAVAAGRLADANLAAAAERYRSISATPQLRANVELDHPPTLAYYAAGLRSREGVDLLVFADREGGVLASSGNDRLWAEARDVAGSALVASEGFAYAVVATDLESSTGRPVRMVAVERLEPAQIEEWSQLSGSQVLLVPAGDRADDGLHRVARRLGSLDLVVRADLASERAALRRARGSLLAAGSVAVGLSWLACALLARGFVRPIQAMRAAAERIRRGDRELRLRFERNDEVGDVARAFDLMLDGLESSRREVEQHLADLELSREHLANAQRLARLGSFELDVDTAKGEVAAFRASPQFRELYALGPGPETDDAERILARIHPEDREAVEEAFRRSSREGSSVHLDYRIQLPDGVERVLAIQARSEGLEDGRTRRLSGTVQDVTERRRADEQIRFLAFHDGLTGLGNRTFFLERLAASIQRARRRERSVGVLFLDLDRFKRVNDTFGHSVGDEVLRQVADRLVRSLREYDVVSRPDPGEEFPIPVSRLGGDEFIVLMDDIRDAGDLAQVAQRILAALEPPFVQGGHELVLGASIGIAVWPEDGEDADSLLRNADSAMYHAKENGRNDYQFYASSMNEAAMERLELEERMRRALEQGQFEMHYQPKVELQGGRVSGYEALMRWRDPERGLVPPGEFIPVAEQSGLIVPLGEFALRAACRQLAAWQAAPPSACRGSQPSISVNLSLHQFRSGTLLWTVRSALREAGARPEGLDLEITESMVVHDEERVVLVLEELRSLGIRVSLDDFGTGQSSLSHLRRLPVDTLKIDMSFVRSIVESDRDARLTAAIVAMGKARGLCVVAEGVESEAQRSLLASWGCDEIQGYLVSPALPAEEASLLG